MKNPDRIRAESTFSVLGIFGNFNTQKLQKNIKKNIWKMYLKIAMYVDDFKEENEFFCKFMDKHGDLLLYRFFEVLAK